MIEGCRTIVSTITNWELAPCVETQRPYTRDNRAMHNIENHRSLPPAVCGGASVYGMRNSSSKRGGHVQTREEPTSILCCTIHTLNTIGTWLIGKSSLEEIHRVYPLVNLGEISFGLLCCVP